MKNDIIIPQQHKLSGFAEACYDQNSLQELRDALNGSADETDCRNWGITPDEWRAAIKQALETRLDDAERKAKV